MSRNTQVIALLMTIIVFVVGAMSACGGNPASTSAFTPASNDDMAVSRNLAEIQAQGTLEAIEAQRQATQNVFHAWNTATMQAQNWQATQIAATATQQAEMHIRQTQSVQNTQTAATMQAQASIATATAQAACLQATATVQAANLQSTATAHVRGTQGALSVQQTKTAMDLRNTVEANNIAAAKKVQDAEVELAELALKRARMMNEITAVAPYLGGAIGFIILSILLYRLGTNEANRRKVFVDETGTPRGVVDVTSQGVNFTMTDRMPSPSFQTDPRGNISYPQAAELALQAQTTILALMAEALAAGKSPQQMFADIQELLQVPQLPGGNYNQLPRGEVIDVQVVDVSNQTAKDWMSDVQEDFVDEDF